MADIRIKDLTTLESASLTGDVFVIDGTTGTRKLSAFSPTFGGNATVTGTLTVNGTGTSEFGGLVRVTAGGFRAYGSMTLGATYAAMGGGFQTSYDSPTTRIFYGDGTGFDLRFATRASSTTTDRFTFSDTGKLTISGTDASTTTSTGALVVSGGVGVGGAINAGANNAANSITGGDSGSGTHILQLKDGGGNLKVTFKGNGDVNLQSSTASTTTSSGALVVSGGVGVGGAANIGGTLDVNGNVTLGDYVGDADVVIAAQSTGVGNLRWRPTASATNAYGFTIAYDGPNSKLSFLRHEFSTAGTEWMSVARTTGNATFAGAISIGNTVNTVSPTSPNRTITMVIGGTTYYLAAKTTND